MVPRLLAQSFEEVLYRLYKPQPPESLPPKIGKPAEASQSSSSQPQTAPRSPWPGSKRMDANTFWENLRKADNLTQKQFFDTLSSLTTREQRKEWLSYRRQKMMSVGVAIILAAHLAFVRVTRTFNFAFRTV
jgi:hypothetical protein